MELNTLNAISPVDGRYRRACEELALHFSEEALMRYRVMVEVEYFIELCEIPLAELKQVDSAIFPKLRKIYHDFNFLDAQKIKEIER
jgi:adenylosuccinate lyase